MERTGGYRIPFGSRCRRLVLRLYLVGETDQCMTSKQSQCARSIRKLDRAVTRSFTDRLKWRGGSTSRLTLLLTLTLIIWARIAGH